MECVPKEVEKHLPKIRLINFKWRWWWFKNVNLYRMLYKERIANAVSIWIGPLEIIIRRRYLIRVARSLFPEAFIKAGREDLL